MKKNITIIRIYNNERVDLSKFTITFVAKNWVRGYWNGFAGFPIVFARFNGYEVIVKN